MWILVALLLAACALIWWRARKARLPNEFTLCEYWVYLPEPKLPVHEEIMTRMVSDNPHSRPGRACIGSAEGLIFSDVRLYVNVATRKKNPHAFRPDLVDTVEGLSQEALERLAASQGLVQIRYISPERVKDFRHLQFLPQMADAVSSLGNGLLVFDQVLGRIWLAEEFFAKLELAPRTMTPDFHVETRWNFAPEGGFVETRGLIKIGLWELRSELVPEDQKTLALAVVEAAAFSMWASRTQPNSLVVEAFGDNFIVQSVPQMPNRQRVLTIVRQIET